MHDFEYSLGFRECGFREEFLDNKSFLNCSEISATDRRFAVFKRPEKQSTAFVNCVSCLA